MDSQDCVTSPIRKPIIAARSGWPPKKPQVVGHWPASRLFSPPKGRFPNPAYRATALGCTVHMQTTDLLECCKHQTEMGGTVRSMCQSAQPPCGIARISCFSVQKQRILMLGLVIHRIDFAVRFLSAECRQLRHVLNHETWARAVMHDTCI